MFRRHIAWRNRNAQDKTLRELGKASNVCLMLQQSGSMCVQQPGRPPEHKGVVMT
jgi:hypothetical protein